MIRNYTPYNLYDFNNRLIIPFNNLLSKIELRGIRVDLNRAKEIEIKLESTLNDLYKKFTAKYGPLNYNAKPDCEFLLFKTLGMKPIKFTKENKATGKKKEAIIDTSVLSFYESEGCEAAGDIKVLRKIDKLLNTFIRNYIYKNHVNGIIYVNYNQTGTVTGRLSSSGLEDDENSFNAQNLPNDYVLPDGTVISIRSIFIPRPGYVFVHADASQSELRVLGWYTNEPVLVNAANENRDMHSANAEGIFNIDAKIFQYKAENRIVEYDEKGKPIDYFKMRRDAKNIGFAWIYGASTYKVYTMLEGRYTYQEVEEKEVNYFKRFSNIKFWKSEMHRLAHENHGYFFSCFGRRRGLTDLLSLEEELRLEPLAKAKKPGSKEYLYVAEHDLYEAHKAALREGLNSIIQGTSHDYIDLGLIEAYNNVDNDRAFLLLETHDSCDNEVKEAYADEFSSILKEILQKPKDPVDIRMKFDAEKQECLH